MEDSMDGYTAIGKSVQRKEAWDKVTGAAKYTDDIYVPGLLYAWMLTSPYAHANILSIDKISAERAKGVRRVLTGEFLPALTGTTIEDRPPIARDKVRYYGEPVVVIIADSEAEAKSAASLIQVSYAPLPVVNSPGEASKVSAPLVHEKLGSYRVFREVFPKQGTNIANHTKIRKGNMNKGWRDSKVIIEENFSFPQSDHVAMETRSAMAEVLPDGQVIIYASSQSPFPIKDDLSMHFGIDPGKVTVHVPLVGGAYGGKTPIQLEFIAFMASKAIGGRPVKLTNTREADMVTSPVHIGLEAKVKLGCGEGGKLTAAEITYWFDGGAYGDRAVIISKSAAVDCTGPYNIGNVWCDSYCMYTNHPYATAFRGFGHPELTFVMERTMDILAEKLDMDPLELRLRNSILPGFTAPTQTRLDRSNVGNLPGCMAKAASLIQWEGGQAVEIKENRVRAKGISCFWKNSNTPTNAEGGAVLTFNRDGSINLNCGAVEIGQGTKTTLAQVLAEKMKMDVDKVHVIMEVNTETAPEHWKTAASRTTFLVGNAVIAAAEDAISKLKRTAARVLEISEGNLEVEAGRVFLKDKPNTGIDIKEIAHGYTYPDGHSIEGQVIGKGEYIMEGLTYLDEETGKGTPGPEWAVGAAAVEVELELTECTYSIVKAACVVDAGKVINPKAAKGQISGGMSMGLSFGSREAFAFTDKGTIQNASLRTYRPIRLGENPEYLVDFIETPHTEGPFGARGIGEYGVIGMPGALANALSAAAGVKLNHLPLTAEFIWNTRISKFGKTAGREEDVGDRL
jgi:CO/xanthine dehydrogenase Mo-binding subunit